MLLNDPTQAVAEALAANAIVDSTQTTLIQGTNVVVKKIPSQNTVAVISGGGSGHEPSHASWVGDGMLDAAVCGNVFASPSTAEVLAAILHVTKEKGCLVIVKNYTGDRLNFGLACEQAKAAGKKVEMLVVGDDCSLPNRDLGIAGRRGLAGTVLIHKVAGAAASQGKDLDHVLAAARAAAESVGTIGVALQRCRPFGLPAGAPYEQIEPGMVELGLGIHGEKGFAVRKLEPCDALVKRMMDMLLSQDPGYQYLSLKEGDAVALLVNNLGATTAIEVSIATRAAIDNLRDRGVHVACCYCGSYMTALDMAGISISLMKLDDDGTRRNLLELPASPKDWIGASHPTVDVSPIPCPSFPPAADLSKIPRPTSTALLDVPQQDLFRTVITQAAQSIVELEQSLTEWDTKVGDGDCGHTLRAGASAILADLEDYPLGHPREVIVSLGCSLSRSMGGTSGALYNILISAATASLPLDVPPSAKQVSEALTAGVDAISRYGGASPGDCTMLDALSPSARAMLDAAVAGRSMGESWKAAAEAATRGAQSTAAMVASAGRASYLSDVVGIPDPGAMAVAQWIKTVANVLSSSE